MKLRSHKSVEYDLRHLGDNVCVGILSDSHGWIDPQIAKVLSGADVLLHAGDLCGDAVLEQLNRLTTQLVAVAGNNDHYLMSADNVEKLPLQARIRLPGGMVVLEHGHQLNGFPHPALVRRTHPEARMIVFGHSHQLLIDQNQQPWVVNPGASGAERVGLGASCIVLRIKGSQWLLEPYQVSESWQRESA